MPDQPYTPEELLSKVSDLENLLGGVVSSLERLSEPGDSHNHDGLEGHSFAMQGDDVVFLSRPYACQSEYEHVGVYFCQHWEKEFPDIRMSGGSSGAAFTTENVENRGSRWTLRKLEDPILKLRARLSEARMRIVNREWHNRRDEKIANGCLDALRIICPERFPDPDDDD